MKITDLWTPGLAALFVFGFASVDVAAQAEVFVDCSDCPEMVRIEPGEYLMGATDEELRIADLPPYFAGREKPRHRVRIDRPFAVARFEVSRDQYRRFVSDTGYEPADGCWAFIGSEFIFEEDRNWDNSKLNQEGNHPVTCIAWVDAVAFTDWLSQRTGHRYRLLSEAEWEYMARAGTRTTYWFGDSAEKICEYVNLGDFSTRDHFRWHETEIKFAALDNWRNAPCRDGFSSTAPVDFGAPNAFGVYNVLGNVQELVADCWSPSYASGPHNAEPRLTSGDCAFRTMRGQGWSAIESSARSAFRAKMLATDRRFYLGIRVARDIPQGG